MRPLWLFALLTIGCSDLDQDGARDGRDCEPTNAAIHPDAEELCDGIDNNCSGQVDEDVAFVAYWDRDRDGWGDAAYARRVCTLPEDGALVAGDCDDLQPTVHPEAPELCDLADNDCDEEVDEDAGATFYADADGDGHGDPLGATTVACFASAGFADAADDCDDGDPLTYTGAQELCDGVDNDCDEDTDESLPTTRVWEDIDQDGYGDPLAPTVGCGTSIGVADNDLDCDDLDASISPDAIDARGDDLDADCDGWLDEYGVGPGHEFATVEDALASAPDGAVVQLDAGFFVGTIDLRGRDVTFAGEGCGRTTWYADSAGTAIVLDGGRVEAMTVSGGAASFAEPAGALVGGGVAIDGDATLAHVCVANNSATYGGGVAVVSGTATLDDVTLLRNSSVADGAGLYVQSPAVANVVRSRILANVASAKGGGVHARGGTVTVTATVIAGNQADKHGAGAAGTVLNGVNSSLAFDQVTFHANRTTRTTDVDGQALYVEDAAAGGHVANTLHNVLITGHPLPFSLVEGMSSAIFTKEFVGYRGNAGPDADNEIPQPDRIGKEIAYVLADPYLLPEQWDLRLRDTAGFIDLGDPAVFDPDGTPSDLGAFGGPEAPAGWDWGLADDVDGDEMLSGWEVHSGLNPWIVDRGEDPDGDGLKNGEEYLVDSEPWTIDSDDDGVDDSAEVALRTRPSNPRDQAPIADAGHDRYGMIGEPVWLDAGASLDPNGDALSFTWTLDALPPFSSLTLATPAASRFALVPDAAGTYALTVAVADGKTTRSASVRIQVYDGPIVPDDAQTVAGALALAFPGQAVGIRPGAWTAGIDLGASEAVLIGLIDDGAAADVVLDGRAAASVLSAEGEVTLAQLTLANGYAIGGGGLRVDSATRVTLEDVIVRDSFAAEGGGVWVSGDAAQLALDDVQLVDNRAEVQGGGLFVSGFSVTNTLVARRTVFSGNEAPLGGGLFAYGGGLKSPTGVDDANFYLDACTFVGNGAEAGAAFHHSGAASDLMVWNTTFAGNHGGSLGMAVGGRATIASDLVTRNEVGVLWDGEVDIQHHQGLGPDFAVVPVFGEDVTGLSVDLVTWQAYDPLLALFSNDGNPANDLWVHLLDSEAIDAGYIDDLDPDGSRSDAGACSGPYALPRCQSFAFDNDEDGLGDGWERAVGLDPTVDDSLSDTDGDGLDALAEADLGTDPSDADTDGDGVTDAIDAAPSDDRDHRPQVVVDPFVIAEAVGAPVTVDAGASFDPDGREITFAWAVVSAPAGSALTSGALAAGPDVTFVPDQPGTYVLTVTAAAGGVVSRIGRVWVRPRVVIEVAVDGSGDVATIDEAIAAAEDGDVISIGPGEWDVHLGGADFPLVFQGAGIGQTILTAADPTPLVALEPWDSVVLRDLTLTDALGGFGGAVTCEQGELTLERVRVERSVAWLGGGLYLVDCVTTLTDVEVIANEAAFQGAGVYVLGGTLDWTRGLVARNRASTGAAGLQLSSADAVLRNVEFRENWSIRQASAIGVENGSGRGDGDLVAEHLTFVGNRSATGVSGAVARQIGAPVMVRSSIFVANAPYAVYDASTLDGLVLEGNAYWNGGMVSPASKLDADYLAADPTFASPSDVRLLHASPARDLGPDLDPDGSLADRGAYGGPDAGTDWDRFLRDLDGDGMADQWELAAGLDPSSPDADGDPDLDAVPNLVEYGASSDPYQTDSDGDGVSDPDEVAAATAPADPFDHAPRPSAGPDLSADLGATIVLSGSATDPQGDAITYRWSLIDQPGRSLLTDADLLGSDAAQVSFVPDSAGAYVLRLDTTDALGGGPGDPVTVRVVGEILVPEDYPTVGEAVDAAGDHATLRIGPGVWPAHVLTDGKHLTLTGAGADLTVLDGEGTGSVITMVDLFESLTVESLTLAGGRAGRGGGLWVSNAGNVNLFDVTLEDNVSADGGALFAEGALARLTVSDSRFVGNRSGFRGGGLSVLAILALDVDRTLFAGNAAPNDNGGAVRIERGGPAAFTNVVFSDNAAAAGGALFATGSTGDSVELTMDHATATYNSASVQGPFLKLNQYTTLTLTNSIVAGHRTLATVQATGAKNTLTQTYTLFAGNDTDYALAIGAPIPQNGVDGNVFAFYPGFAATSEDGDWTDEDWLLAPVSAAIDAADAAVDLDPDGSPPDMGAFGGAGGDWAP